jgi:hypothetical protein
MLVTRYTEKTKGTRDSCIRVRTEICRLITTGTINSFDALAPVLNLCAFSIKIVNEIRHNKVESIDGHGIVVAIVETQVKFKRIPIFLPK